MKKRSKQSILLASSLVAMLSLSTIAATTPVSAITATAAHDLEAKVKATGLKHSKTTNGGFKFLFGTNVGRSQLVFMDGSPESYGGVQFVEIWSYSVRSLSRPVSVDQMREMVDGSGRGNYELGHWCLCKLDSGKEWVLYYSVHMPLSSSAEEFEAALRHCSEMADDKELELSGKDDF